MRRCFARSTSIALWMIVACNGGGSGVGSDGGGVLALGDAGALDGTTSVQGGGQGGGGMGSAGTGGSAGSASSAGNGGSGGNAASGTDAGTGGTPHWQMISAGIDHTCGIHGGRLYCWGANALGQLGDGTTEERRRPTRVGDETDWEHVAAGALHTCGIRAGRLYCWGYNLNGALGDGSTIDRTSPTQVGNESDWQTVAAGDTHTCGTRSGQLYCWGQNETGTVGDGSTVNRPSPTRIGSATDWQQLALSQTSTCGIRAGQLHCWGLQGVALLYAGSLVGGPDAGTGMVVGYDLTTPLRIGDDSDWSHIAASITHVCGLRADRLYCFGGNSEGQLGIGTTVAVSEPTEVTGEAGWSDVELARSRSCAIRSGSLYCWGHNPLQDAANLTVAPEPVQLGSDSDWEHIERGEGHMCGLRADAQLYCRGSNRFGQVGDGTTSWGVITQFTRIDVSAGSTGGGEICHAERTFADMLPKKGTGLMCTEAPCSTPSTTMKFIDEPCDHTNVKYSCCGVPGGVTVYVYDGCNTSNCESEPDWMETCAGFGGVGQKGLCP